MTRPDDTEPSAEAQTAALELRDELTQLAINGRPEHERIKSIALALDRFRADGVREERERQQAIVHSLCPDAKNNWCRGGMLYDTEGKEMGACEWEGHVAGGYT